MQDKFQIQKVKILLIGNSSVGKTSIIERFLQVQEHGKLDSTVGMKMHEKQIEYNDQKYTLQIWDTAGKDCYRKITKAHYRFCKGVVLVFDISNKQSFKDIPGWVNEIKRYCEGDVEFELVGNKLDKEQEGKREVDEELAKNYAEVNGINYVETSAHFSFTHNIQLIFHSLIHKIHQAHTLNQQRHQQNAAQVQCQCTLF